MKRLFDVAVVAAMVMGSSVGTAFGQTSKGILTGVLRDSSGAVVPNASVTITNQETGETRKATSTGEGAYRVEAISPGKYTIVSTASGFQTSKVSDIVVRSTSVTSYDVVLSIGSASTEVSVEANQGL